jgi:microcystin degradation protein MlrC
MVVAGNVTPEGVPTTEVLMASVPPTSLRAWSVYVKALRDMGRPVSSMVTRIGLEPFKTFFHVTFEPVARIGKDLYDALKARGPSIEEMMMAPYRAADDSEGEAEAAPVAKRGRNKKL